MIVVNLDVMLAKRKMTSGELAEKVGITQANLSVLKTGKAKAVRFSTLEAICRALRCQPGDILEYTEDETGLISLKVITEDAEFTLESFPPDCCLITDEVPGILLRYYYPLPAEAADWDEILQNDTVLLTFDCLNGQWVLTECTDDLTWTAVAKDGCVTFNDYKQPGPEWEWSAELDGDLMTFDFSALDALITRYNTLIPDRPSVTEP